MKLTKQGVRDLDAALGPRRSRGRRLPTPPRQQAHACPHRRTYEVNEQFNRCEDCGNLVFDGTEDDAFYNFG